MTNNYKKANRRMRLFDLTDSNQLDVKTLFIDTKILQKHIINETEKAVNVVYAVTFNGFNVTAWIPKDIIVINRFGNVCVPTWFYNKILHISSNSLYENAFDNYNTYEDYFDKL